MIVTKSSNKNHCAWQTANIDKNHKHKQKRQRPKRKKKP